MKKFSFLLFLLAGTIVAFAQSSAKTVDFKKSLRPALLLPLTVNPQTSEETILAKLKETGYKPEKNGNLFNKKNKEEGYYKFSGVVLPQLANQKLDLYFKVDPMEADNFRSSITLMVSKGYDNFVSPENDSATYQASQDFLNGFVQNANVYNINQLLEEQTKSIAKSEKKWTELRDKQQEAKKKIDQLQGDIQTWHQEEELQQQEVEKLRSELKDLEAKRTSANSSVK